MYKLNAADFTYFSKITNLLCPTGFLKIQMKYIFSLDGISITPWSRKGLNGTVLNRTFHSYNGGSYLLINVFKDGKFGLYAPATGGMDMLGMFK